VKEKIEKAELCTYAVLSLHCEGKNILKKKKEKERKKVFIHIDISLFKRKKVLIHIDISPLRKQTTKKLIS
jgi:hypothetical protein